MSFEVEIKFRVHDHAALAGRLSDIGVLADVPQAQNDLYLSHPSRDFATSDEALRLRRDGQTNHITYKGPRRAGPTKTREEIEIPFAEGPEGRADMARLFERLGFTPVLEVRKTRLTYRLRYHGRPIVVALDKVENLGAFAEVEALAANEADLPAAQDAVRTLAGELGLTDLEPRSYLRMVLEHLHASQPEPSHPRSPGGTSRNLIPGPSHLQPSDR